MRKKEPRKRNWFKLLIQITTLVLMGIFLSKFFFTAAEFGNHVNNFIFHLKNNDPVRSKLELEYLHYFYNLSKKWKIQWLADRYLFKDAIFYEAADLYLVEDWDAVINKLQSRLEDPKSYPYSNARFRQAQQLYLSGKRKEAIDLVVKVVSQDFKRDLINCLNNETEYLYCFDRVWNYDLLSNPRYAEEALKQKKTKPKYILGPIEKGKGVVNLKDDEPVEEKNKLDEEKKNIRDFKKRP
jgi:hypothetical protein